MAATVPIMSTGEKDGGDSLEGQISGGASLSDSWAVSGELFAIRNWQRRHFSQTTLHGEVQYYLADECTAGFLSTDSGMIPAL